MSRSWGAFSRNRASFQVFNNAIDAADLAVSGRTDAYNGGNFERNRILYLDAETVESTLRKIAGTAEGSIVVFDYLTKETLESKSLYMRYARAVAKAVGEPFKFGIDGAPPLQQRMAEFLSTCGLSLSDHSTLGKETDGKRAWGGFATAMVGSTVQAD